MVNHSPGTYNKKHDNWDTVLKNYMDLSSFMQYNETVLMFLKVQ